ncbi:LacI family DNA-binding transcriptional regulator [Neobacillus niacini]|uniref:LacI family DNA-binding transcriptional regulator n=1 Tax=Neobacillus niacini TaxID=86668 RepID=UPI00300035D9
MTTIKDIATLANVSTATVSRILNNDATLSVTDETRKKVLDIVNELDYKPLRKKSVKAEKKIESFNIGLIFLNDESVDPYFQSIRLGVEGTCSYYPINIVSAMVVGKSVITSEILSELDGLIVIGDIDTEEIKKIYFQNNNIVVVDYLPSNDSNVDVVISDFEGATKQILDYLLDLGHQDIAYVGGRGLVHGVVSGKMVEKVDIRKSTFEKVVKEKGLYNPSYVLEEDWGPANGYSLTKQLLEQGKLPSAIVVGSDPMALGVLRALHESGIHVPTDVSVVSFDDIEAAAYVNPRLSTVKVHGEEMGRAAVKLLYDRLLGRKIPMKVILPTELIIRDSTSSKKI